MKLAKFLRPIIEPFMPYKSKGILKNHLQKNSIDYRNGSITKKIELVNLFKEMLINNQNIT